MASILERANTAKRVGWYTLVGLVLLPLVLGGVLMYALHDPQTRLDHVGAAIVNQDKGTKVDGQFVPLGRELSAGLVKGRDGDGDDQNYDWQLTDASDARAGLADGRYAVVVTIPRTFSKDATSYRSATSARPATIHVRTSAENRILDAAISNVVTDTATRTLGRTLSENYLKNVYVSFGTLHDKLGDAADGADGIAGGLGKTSKGAGDLADGADQLGTGTSSLAGGLDQLADGAGQAAAGTSGLATGAHKLAAGDRKLAAGAGKLAAGNRKSARGARSLAGGAKKLSGGATSLSKGLGGLKTGTRQLAGAASQVSTGASGVSTGTATIAQLAKTHPDMTLAELDAALKAQGSSLDGLAGGAAQVSAGSKQVAAGLKPVASGVAQSASGASSLAAGSKQLAGGSRKLAGGLDRLADGSAASAKGARKLASGTESLASGADKLAAGNRKLAAGARASADGAHQLSDGTTALADGTHKLSTGTSRLATGAAKLGGGLQTAVDELPTYSKAQRTKLAGVVANPVRAKGAGQDQVFGDGGVPLVVTVVLWAGVLATYLLIGALSRRTLSSRRSTAGLVLTGYAPGLALGLLQGIGLAGLAQIQLGLPVASWLAFTAFGGLAGAAFAAIVQGVVAVLGGTGRFVVAVAGIVAVAAGILSTAPAVVLQTAAALPTGAAGAGLLHIVTGTDGVTRNAVTLVVWLLVGLTLSTVAVLRARTIRPAALVPSV